MVKILDNLSSVIDNYDLFIVDIWGVVHNDGTHTFDGVLDLLSKIKLLNKKLVFLSNAPRRKAEIERTLTKIGITPEYYTDIHTSGEETRIMLTQSDGKYGSQCFVVGSDNNLLENTNITTTQDIGTADFVLGSGFLNNENGEWERKDLSRYDEVIQNALKRKLLWICPNPDIIVRTIAGELYCPGAVAKRYETQGGTVIYEGKPYSSAYKRIFEWFKDIPQNRIVGIGDGINTDIKGANDSGIDSILVVKSGIHVDELWNYDTNSINDSELKSFTIKYQVAPKFAIPLFK